MAVETIIDSLQTIVGGLAGMRQAPADPIEQPTAFPFGVTFPSTGAWEGGSVGKNLRNAAHEVTIVIAVARKDMPRDVQKSVGYADLLQAALQADPTLGGNAFLVQALSYTFGEILWGPSELSLLGYTFTVTVQEIDC